MKPRERPIGATEHKVDGPKVIFYSGCTTWGEIPVDKRWMLFLDTMLHEAIHAFYARFSLRRDLPVKGEHDAPWHLAALHLERVASSTLGYEVDLGRKDSLKYEVSTYRQLNLTNDKLIECFGNAFNKNRKVQRLLRRQAKATT